MIIKSNEIEKAIVSFVENDLMNKGNALQQGILTFVLLQGKNKINNMLSFITYFADEKGEFNLEELHQNLSKALSKMGGKYTIPLINYNLDNDDLNTIFEYIRSNHNEKSLFNRRDHGRRKNHSVKKTGKDS